MARPSSRSGSRFPQARKVVPVELRAILGRREFTRSLPAADPAEVKRMHLAAMAEFETEIAAARAKLKGESSRLTAKQTRAIAGARYLELLNEHEDDPGTPGGWEAQLDALSDEIPDHNPDEDPQPFEPGPERLMAAEEVLRKRGVAGDPQTIRDLAVALFEAETRAAITLKRRAEGDYGPDQYAATFPALDLEGSGSPKVKEEALTFSDLVDKWVAERRAPLKTREKWEAAFAGFADVVGHDDAKRVSRADVRQWKEARQAAGKSAKTIADGIGVMRSTVNWAIKNGLLVGPNPFAGMAPKIDKSGPSAREGYTDEEARAILLAARNETGWLRWLPWLLAFSGARIDEVAGLRRQDVRQESGVWILDIQPTAERRLKNAHSQRMVPLHPAIMAEGFLAFVKTVPAGGPLFVDLAKGRYGSQGSVATKTHSRWVRRTVGITDPRKAPAHSWRHRMEDELRRARVTLEAQDAITGHDNPRNAGAGYGRGFRGMPDETLKELSKVPSPLT